MRRANRSFCTLVSLVAALAAGSASAEQGCPDGSTPNPLMGGTPGQNQCVPIPGLSRPQGGVSPVNAGPQVRWASRCGAIVVDSDSGKTGVAGSMSTRKKAENGAVAQCKGKGGRDCQVKISYANQCGVIAWGNYRMATANAPTLEEASSQTLTQCEQASGVVYEVFFSDCSFPERI